ncbi:MULTISPECIES: ATP-binding protein [unclassified Solwaraspora]|uniref:ATP-binding protein n=1 Tax=unclassified Solwaraspora TaxID=2627926 RepID=UPI00259B17EA|nr:ATP-binding protein [Solwaraspora sp. WMMA2056]WJK40416.1 hypothetical protein O7608_29160 [Solwaraspora sp. WMMA2056]
MAATRTRSSRIRPPGTSPRRDAAGPSGDVPSRRRTAVDRPDETPRTAAVRLSSQPIVRLVGELTTDTVGQLRDALLDCLADRAAPLGVDVSGLHVAEPTALLRLADVPQTVADWPAGGLVCTAPPPGAGSLWAAAGFSVLPDRQLACALLAGAPAARALGVELEPVAGAARSARALLTRACRQWDVPQLIDPAALALTELVNNVVVHAGTAMSVRIGYRDGCLRLSVRDGSPGAPRPGSPVSPTALGGRGMWLVESVARRWGCTALADGKLVWAVLDPADRSWEGA